MEGVTDWLARYGWNAESQESAALDVSYGRPVPSWFGGGFVIAAMRHLRS